jgi:hypothetical protein
MSNERRDCVVAWASLLMAVGLTLAAVSAVLVLAFCGR